MALQQSQLTSLANLINSMPRQELVSAGYGTLTAEFDDEGNPVQLDCTVYDNNAGDLQSLWQLHMDEGGLPSLYLKNSDERVSDDEAFDYLQPFLSSVSTDSEMT